MAGARLALVGTVVSSLPGSIVAHGEWQQEKVNDKFFILSLTLHVLPTMKVNTILKHGQDVRSQLPLKSLL